MGYECEYLESLNATLTRKLGGHEESDSSDDEGEEVDNDEDEAEDWAGTEDIAGQEMGDGFDNGLTLEDIQLESATAGPPSDNQTQTSGPPDIPSAQSQKLKKQKSRVGYRPDTTGAAPDLITLESDPFLKTQSSKFQSFMGKMGTPVNTAALRASALGSSRGAQALIYVIAFGVLVFVLVAHATHLGAHEEEAGHGGEEGHRRLGGAAPLLLKNIALSIVCAGAVSFVVNWLRWPLCIGYILGGVVVGPNALKLVSWEGEIKYVIELGLIFLLFMIGSGLDFRKLWGLNRVAWTTGFAQFPICVCATFVILSVLKLAGLELGKGEYAITYASLACSLSSTLMVGKLMGQSADKDSPSGKITTGVLLIQDLWAIVVLAVQPNLDLLHPKKMLVSFFWVLVILFCSLAYAKLIVPPVLFSASKSVELMLVLALAWIFFVVSASILPFVELSMELGALISGAAMATFPYSADLNSKLHFVRDFFITIFFIGMGADIPAPTGAVVGKAVLLCVIVTVVRWASIPLLVTAVGGHARVGVLATINLSQISELALAICVMGTSSGFGPLKHVDHDFQSVITWAFLIMAIAGTYGLSHKHTLMRAFMSVQRRFGEWFDLKKIEEDKLDEDDWTHHAKKGDIVILGFHRITALLIPEFMMKSPNIVERLHVIDINQNLADGLREKGITFTYGDFASAKELKRCHPDKATIVMSTIPDSLLRGVTNLKLLHVAKKVWPEAHFIATADNPVEAMQLYDAGADYVVRMAKLSAIRLHELLVEHCSKAFGGGDLNELFDRYKGKDKDARSRTGGFLALRM